MTVLCCFSLSPRAKLLQKKFLPPTGGTPDTPYSTQSTPRYRSYFLHGGDRAKTADRLSREKQEQVRRSSVSSDSRSLRSWLRLGLEGFEELTPGDGVTPSSARSVVSRELMDSPAMSDTEASYLLGYVEWEGRWPPGLKPEDVLGDGEGAVTETAKIIHERAISRMREFQTRAGESREKSVVAREIAMEGSPKSGRSRSSRSPSSKSPEGSSPRSAGSRLGSSRPVSARRGGSPRAVSPAGAVSPRAVVVSPGAVVVSQKSPSRPISPREEVKMVYPVKEVKVELFRRDPRPRTSPEMMMIEREQALYRLETPIFSPTVVPGARGAGCPRAIPPAVADFGARVSSSGHRRGRRFFGTPPRTPRTPVRKAKSENDF